MNGEILKVLAKKIKYHRKSRGLTQVQLSLDSGVEHRHLQKIEAGRVDLRLGTIAKIARSLKVPTCYLLEDFVPVDQENIERGPIEITSGSPLPISATNIDLDLKFANNAFYKMLGLGKEDTFDLKEFLVSSTEMARLEEVKNFVSEKLPEPKPFIVKLQSKSGEVFDKLVSWSYLHGPDKAIIGFTFIHLEPSFDGVLPSFADLKPSIGL